MAFINSRITKPRWSPVGGFSQQSFVFKHDPPAFLPPGELGRSEMWSLWTARISAETLYQAGFTTMENGCLNAMVEKGVFNLPNQQSA